MYRIVELWRGEIPLVRTFWQWAILGGFLANAAATVAALTAVAAGALDLLAAALFFAPIPYDMLMVVGVWRSAARYNGNPANAQSARVAVLVWATAMLVL